MNRHLTVGFKLWEAELQILFEDHLEPLQIHRGKTRGIGYVTTAGLLIQLHMAGGVRQAPQLLADLGGLNGEARVYAV